MAGESRRADTRIGDAGRASATGVLTTALREGRIDLAEYERRLATVQAARLRKDLAQAIADLPGRSGDSGPGLRVSAIERAQALVRLAEALTDGRIDPAAYAGAEVLLHRAVTYADVDAVVGGLDARASLAERDQAIERLEAAAAAGLLDPAERAGRAAAARNAVTGAQLAALVADLPTDSRPVGAEAAFQPSVRSSNTDRDGVAARLQAAAREGLLDPAELDERLRAARAARLRTELARLVADLPAPGRVAVSEPVVPQSVVPPDDPPTPSAAGVRAWRFVKPGTAVVVLGAAGLAATGRLIAAGSLGAAWAIGMAVLVRTRPGRTEPAGSPPVDPGPRFRVQTARELHGHKGYIRALVCLALPDGTPVAISGARDNTAIVWDLHDGSQRHTLAGHTHNVDAVAAMILPDGSPVAVTASSDRTIRTWDLRDGSPRGELPRPARGIRALACLTLPDGTPAVVAHGDSVIQLWDLWNNRFLHQFDHDSGLHGALPVLLLDGKPVAVTPQRSGEEYPVAVVNLADGIQKACLTGHTESITAIDATVLPDGTPVAVSASWDKTLRVWDLRQGSLLYAHTGFVDRIEAVACLSLPDGTPIVVAGSGRNAQVWDLRDGTEVGTLDLREGAFAGLSVPERSLIVSPGTLYGVFVRTLV